MQTTDVQVDANFPGGNVIVERVAGSEIWIRQDRRDTPEHWFYWYCRARGAEGRTITVHFGDVHLLPALGPSVSFDGGQNWQWLGAEHVHADGQGFTLACPTDARDVRLSMTIPYTAAHLDETLAELGPHPRLTRSVLCSSRKGRPVTLLRVGNPSARRRALIVSRHHACESMATYTLDGLLRHTLTAAEAPVAWLRENAELVFVPFVDTDGVEDGDQGKMRAPHDHNRDYEAAKAPIYNETRAIKTMVESGEWTVDIGLDLHCPWIKSDGNEHVYAVGQRDPAAQAKADVFLKILESCRQGPLPFRAADTLPHGTGWNNFTGPARTFTGWMAGKGIAAVSFEVPYAIASGVTVTPATARALGADMARALGLYLQHKP